MFDTTENQKKMALMHNGISKLAEAFPRYSLKSWLGAFDNNFSVSIGVRNCLHMHFKVNIFPSVLHNRLSEGTFYVLAGIYD